jgi:hypothetical protein
MLLIACGPTAPAEDARGPAAIEVEPASSGAPPEPIIADAAAEDSAPTAAEAVEDGRPYQQAKQEFQAGVEAYQRGDYASARAHFETSYALSNKAVLLHNLMQAALRQGDSAGACAYRQTLEARAAQDASLQEVLARSPQPCAGP